MAFLLRRFLVFLICTGYLRNFAVSATPKHTPPNIILPPGDQISRQENPPKTPAVSVHSVSRSFRTDGMDSTADSEDVPSFIVSQEIKNKFLKKHNINKEQDLKESLDKLSNLDSKR